MNYEQPQRMSWMCALACALAGLGCIVGGIVQFSLSSEDTRAVMVGQYDAGVDYWNGLGRAQFKGVKCVVANMTGAGSYSLTEQSSVDKMIDKSSSDLHEYQPLWYSHSGSIAPGLQWNSQAGKLEADVKLTCSGGASKMASLIVLPQVALYKTDTLVRSNQKQCRYQHKGSYTERGCETYWVAKDVCVKLSLLDGKWALNKTWGGYGCHSTNDWAVNTFMQVPGSDVSFSHGLPPSGAVDLSSMKVQVRSGLDPWLNAEELTHDSMDFGATAAEEVTIGIILEVLGCLLLVPMAYRCYEAYMYKKERHERSSAAAKRNLLAAHSAMEEEEEEEESYSNPLQSAAMPMTSMASSFGGPRGLGIAKPDPSRHAMA